MIIRQHNVIPISLNLMQRENSPSGTTGTITMYPVGGVGEFKINFDCPYIGTNKCKFSGHIPGLKITRESWSGSSGSVASCTILIEPE